MDQHAFAPTLIGSAAMFVVGLYLLFRNVDVEDRLRSLGVARVIVGICLLVFVVLTVPFSETSMLAQESVWLVTAGICCVAAITALVGKRFQTKLNGWLFTWIAVAVLLLVVGAEFVAAAIMLIAAVVFIMIRHRGTSRDIRLNESAITCIGAAVLIVVLFGVISHAVFNESQHNTATRRRTALPRTALIQSTIQQSAPRQNATNQPHLLRYGMELYGKHPISVIAIGVLVMLGFVGTTLVPRLLTDDVGAEATDELGGRGGQDILSP